MSDVDNTGIVAMLIYKAGLQRLRVWECACGTKNRVDVARVVANGDRPNCGRCKRPLVGRAQDVEELVVSAARRVWSHGSTEPDRNVN